ncbi:MAG: adenosylcobinamide-GDP ribazoletransferase, partial [Streptosporangiaceae bacterium]
MTGAGEHPGTAAPPPSAPRVPAWRVALSLFTVIPAGVRDSLDEGAAVRAVFWLPVLGAGLGLAGSAVMVFVAAGKFSPERQLLGAALAVALLAVATGGLHLDGLADTADGLGSRRPADQALEIMRRSDAGPLGVATLLLVLLVQVSALASLPRGWAGGGWAGAPGLVLAAVTSRVAVVLATGSPSARPSGFGALVAGRTSAAGRAASVAVLLVAVTAGGLVLGGAAAAARGLLAAVAGLAVAALLRLAARRRLGGMTGDVFGAVIELSTAT